MKVVYQTGIRKLEIGEAKKPEIKPDEVLFQVKSVGICGSDVHYWNEGRIADQIVKFPFILGHECAGEVVEVGAGVKSVKPGSKAAFEPSTPCWKCEWCKKGRYNLCPHVLYLASPPQPGCFQEYIVGKEFQIVPIPEEFSFDRGALLEPLAIGAHSVSRSGFKVGETAAVIGAGPIGLSLLSYLKVGGARTLVVTEKLPYRLKFAQYLNLDGTVDANNPDCIAKVKEFTDGIGADIVFEASGSRDGFIQAIEMARSGGTVVYVGIYEGDLIEMPMQKARGKELDIKLVRREAHGFKPALELAQKGMIQADHWATHRFPVEKIQEAFEMVHQYRDGVIKAMIQM